MIHTQVWLTSSSQIQKPLANWVLHPDEKPLTAPDKIDVIAALRGRICKCGGVRWCQCVSSEDTLDDYEDLEKEVFWQCKHKIMRFRSPLEIEGVCQQHQSSNLQPSC